MTSREWKEKNGWGPGGAKTRALLEQAVLRRQARERALRVCWSTIAVLATILVIGFFCLRGKS
jgi:hypothetical protein